MNNQSRLYVPDAQKWTKFYMEMQGGNVSPYEDQTMKVYQRGGGLRNKTSPYMLSIDKYAKNADSRNLKLNMTSPAEQVVEQAKSELEREKNTEKGKRTMKRISQRSTSSGIGRATKKSKVVKLQSDVFGLY